MTIWYVLQTKTHREEIVQRRLSELCIESYLPRMLVSVRAGLHVQRRIAPMFPSYLFVKLDAGQRAKRVRYTPGVRDFLRSDGAPHPVPSEIVDTVRLRTGPSGVYAPPPARFRPGDRLHVEDGPLRGLDVIFERELSAGERVAVLLAAMSFEARVVLSPRLLAS